MLQLYVMHLHLLDFRHQDFRICFDSWGTFLYLQSAKSICHTIHLSRNRLLNHFKPMLHSYAQLKKPEEKEHWPELGLQFKNNVIESRFHAVMNPLFISLPFCFQVKTQILKFHRPKYLKNKLVRKFALVPREKILSKN